MFSLFAPSYQPNAVNFNFNFNLIGALGYEKAAPAPTEIPRSLSVNWGKPMPGKVLSYLHWRNQVSGFSGREEELEVLREWAFSDQDKSVKFLHALGGCGKTRLAAEFASELQEQGWCAGFASLKGRSLFPMSENGTLMVIDYPEQNPAKLGELIRDLADCGNDCRVRVLLLTRRAMDQWGERLQQWGAGRLIEPRALTLERLTPKQGHALYISTLEKAGKLQDKYYESSKGKEARPPGGPLPIFEEHFADWMKEKPEYERPLFIMAAAVHAVLHPDEGVDRYSGPEVLKCLVDRELNRRLRNVSESIGLGRDGLPRLMAMATMAGGLPVAEVANWDGRVRKLVQMPEDWPVKERLDTADVLDEQGRTILPVEPDLLGAAFCLKVLDEADKAGTAPGELIFHALPGRDLANPAWLEKLFYDAATLGRGNDIPDWLASAVEGDVGRCRVLRALAEEKYSHQLARVGVAVARTLVENAESEQERANWLNNLSNFYSDIGNNKADLEAIQQAVEIRTRLAKANPARFEPELASSLNNLSLGLSDAGQLKPALGAIQQAVEIRTRLVKENPARFEPDLAQSLNNLSLRLSDAGQLKPALEAIQQAIEIRIRLAKENPARFEPDLALSLNNLSNRLKDVGQLKPALEAIQQAVMIRTRLAKGNPARFEPDLAQSLNNLSVRLSDAGQPKSALEASQQAVEIYARLAKGNPARFEPDLALSLNNMSIRLSYAGQLKPAMEAIQQAVEIRTRLARENPARFEPDLADSLNNLSVYLSDAGQLKPALEAIQQAVEIKARLAKENPAWFEPDLATSHGAKGLVLGNLGRWSEAARALARGVELITPYAREHSDSPHAKLLQQLERDLADAQAKAKKDDGPEE